MRTFRVFISSPGDTLAERRRAESVVSRLNGELAGLARLTAVRWETEFYGAHATFQAQIPPSVDCDIVVGILRWRLGTELPPGFETQAGGEPYPSGTAYELLTAIEKRRAGGELPDVFVFRYTGGAPSIVIGETDEVGKRHDWTALQGFFSRWFVSERGHFTAALNTYASEDAFEHQVETLLRKWVAERVSGGRVVLWPAVKGSPFRGLDVFGARHAPVFFGRSADIRKATDLWRDASARNARFLLVVGASGAGKSSLVRAGIVPRLTTPGVVPEVDLWRVAVLRPADSPDGPFVALAAALLRAEADLPPEEDGRGPALPEIAEGDSKTPADLAGMLTHADAGAMRVVANALARIGDQVREADHYDRPVRCDLVLVLDQAEELFAPSVAPALRARFAALLDALLASGRIWLVATLRADLYAAWLEVPVLKTLKDMGAAYDLAPPGVADLAEIVRAPAAAAALGFDRDKDSGESLDETLLREADRPDMLPLVQLALSRLWEARETRGGETVLPLAAFRTLGGLKGIIAEAGEAAIGRLDATRLPPLIRRLAELSHGRGVAPGALTTRAVPLDEAASDAASRALVDALVSARLLTLSDEAGITVRLAHQRVLSDWPRAAEIVADSADFYRVRDEVEAQRQRWEAARKRSDLLLPRGLPLAEARAIAAKYGTELSAETLAYVAASRRRANRAQVVAWSAAAVFALVAIGAGVAGKIASDASTLAEQRRLDAEAQRTEALKQESVAEGRRLDAERQKQTAINNFDIAKNAVGGLVTDFAEGLSVVGLPVGATLRILDTASKAVDKLSRAAPNDLDIILIKARMLDDFRNTLQLRGNVDDALPIAKESLRLFKDLNSKEPRNTEIKLGLSAALGQAGDLCTKQENFQEAMEDYRESLKVMQELVDLDRSNISYRRNLWAADEKIGDAKFSQGDFMGALEEYSAGLSDARSLASIDTDNIGESLELERTVAISLEKIGDIRVAERDYKQALSAYVEALTVSQSVLKKLPVIDKYQHDASVGWFKVGEAKRLLGDQKGALDAYQLSLGPLRNISSHDPSNSQSKTDLAVGLERVGILDLMLGKQSEGIATFNEQLDIMRNLSNEHTTNDDFKQRLSIAINHVGEAINNKDSVNYFLEGLQIMERLASKYPARLDVQHDYMASLSKVGMFKLLSGDPRSALDYLLKCETIAQRLASTNKSNAQAQSELSWVRSKIATIAVAR